MVIQVAVEKSMESKARQFKLDAAFASQEQCVVLFGPSGSGKTLTLQSIAGLVSPDAGTIALNGRVLFDSQNGVMFLRAIERLAIFSRTTRFSRISRCLKMWALA